MLLKIEQQKYNFPLEKTKDTKKNIRKPLKLALIHKRLFIDKGFT
jgi:hypothetical protein